MNRLKIMGNNFLFSFLFLIISTFILSLFSYFNIINGKAITIIQLFICFIAIFMASFKQGKNSNKYGYLEGIKMGSIYLVLFIILNIIFCRLFQLKNYIYYLIIIILSAFGGMIGISRKKNN